jgi:hypothetical protein
MNFISIIHDIRESRATGLLDPDAQAQAGSPLGQVRSNPIRRRFRQQYRHTAVLKDAAKIPAAEAYT